MANVTKQAMDKIVRDMNSFYQPGNEACGKSTPQQMALLLERLSEYTAEVKAAAAEHDLANEWTDPSTGETKISGSKFNPQFSLDMAAWEKRLAHYQRVLDAIPDEQMNTRAGCELVYKQVTAPLLDGIWYEVLDGVVLNDKEKDRMTSGDGHPSTDVKTTVGGKDHPPGHSNAKPPDVISPFTLGNQVLVWKEHQDERLAAFWKFLKESALELGETIGKVVAAGVNPIAPYLIPIGVALLGVSAVGITVAILVARSKKAEVQHSVSGQEAEANPLSPSLTTGLGGGIGSLAGALTGGLAGSLAASAIVQRRSKRDGKSLNETEKSIGILLGTIFVSVFGGSALGGAIGARIAAPPAAKNRAMIAGGVGGLVAPVLGPAVLGAAFGGEEVRESNVISKWRNRAREWEQEDSKPRKSKKTQRSNPTSWATSRDHDRARRIVKLAAEGTKDPYTRDWLIRDEFGGHEKYAMELMEKVRTDTKMQAIIAERGMTTEEIDAEIASNVRLLALQATLASEKKKRGAGKKPSKKTGKRSSRALAS